MEFFGTSAGLDPRRKVVNGDKGMAMVNEGEGIERDDGRRTESRGQVE